MGNYRNMSAFYMGNMLECYGYRGWPRILFPGMFEQEETELTEPATLSLLCCLLFKIAAKRFNQKSPHREASSPGIWSFRFS